MKRYIKSAAEPIYIDITVRFIGDVIEGAKTAPVGKANLTALERIDFNCFVEDIAGLLYTFEFEVKDEHPSKYANSASYYYAFYPTDSDFEVCYDTLYFLRVSTHERQSKQKNPFPEYYKEKVQEFKMPKSKVGTQKHRKMEIIVNNETYDNYDDAYDAVLKKLENLQKRCDKLNGKS